MISTLLRANVNLVDHRLELLRDRWDSDIRAALLDAEAVISFSLPRKLRSWFHDGRSRYEARRLLREVVLKYRRTRKSVATVCDCDTSTVSRWLHDESRVDDYAFEVLVKAWGKRIAPPPAEECVSAGYVRVLNLLRAACEGDCFEELTLEVWEMMIRAWVFELGQTHTATRELDAHYDSIQQEVRSLPWDGLGVVLDPPVRFRVRNSVMLRGQMLDWKPSLLILLGALTS